MKDASHSNARKHTGAEIAAVGLALNILLGALKLAAGILTGSVAVISDGVNNLSDACVSAIVVCSFVLASRAADRAHPLGHGRYEYIAGFVVSALIVVAGAELISTSVRALVASAKAEFDVWTVALMGASVAIKAGMGAFYAVGNAKLRSDTIRAAMVDSFSDCAVTAVAAAAYIAGAKTAFPIDAAVGIPVALFIVYGGLKLLKRTTDRLLGSGRDPEVEKELAALIGDEKSVIGHHDLVVHDYGADRKAASVDLEFDKDMDFSDVHAVIDRIERAAHRRYGVYLVAHGDPVDTSDPRMLAVRRAIIGSLSRYGRNATFHDLEISDDERTARLHLRLSEKLMKEKEHVLAEVIESVRDVMDGYTVEAEFDFL